MRKSKICVYTCVFGNYDTLQNPLVYNPDVDYICFSDHILKSEVWQTALVQPKFVSLAKSSRWYFDNSIRNLPGYTYTIMHGGNSQLNADPKSLVEQYLPDGYLIAAFKHPHRKTVKDECKAVLAFSKDTDIQLVWNQYKSYTDAGFKDDIGLSACILLIRKNTAQVKSFEKIWWREVATWSHRDQLSFDFCRWKTGISVNYIPGDCFASEIFKVGKHK